LGETLLNANCRVIELRAKVTPVPVPVPGLMVTGYIISRHFFEIALCEDAT